jgi:Fur family ferric uptake transcriptional regulator
MKAVNGRGHLDADEIGDLVRKESGPVATQTVYDVLAALTDAGLLRRIDPAGSTAALFESRVGDNHHHLVCRKCRVTHNVDCVLGVRPCLTASDDYGFVIDEAEVTFWGLCPDCQGSVETP